MDASGNYTYSTTNYEQEQNNKLTHSPPIFPSNQLNLKGTRRKPHLYLEDIRSLDEAHERKETTVRPAVNSNSTQIYKIELLRHVLQSLHLVFNLYLTLKRSNGGNVTTSSF